MLLEIGIFTSHLVWLYRTRQVRKAAKEAKMSYDDFVNDQASASPQAGASQETLSDAAAAPTAQVDLEKGVIEPSTLESERTQEKFDPPEPAHVKTERQ